MKKNLQTSTIIILLFSFALGLLMACEPIENLGESNFDTTPYTPSSDGLDGWIYENYTVPYNIEVSYRWQEYENDVNRVLYPPTEENIQPLLEIMQEIWIKPYNQLGGENFIKTLSPRKFVLVGGSNYNPSGSRTLGVAEAGTKISLFNVDQLDITNEGRIKQYFATIQHEYTHILNQTKPFDPAFGKINPEYFTAAWYNVSESQALNWGFITPYSLLNEVEDFAEMVSVMLTNSKASFDAIINGIGGTNPSEEQVTAKANLREKERIIVSYFNSELDIDFYELQRVIEENTVKIVNQGQENEN